MPMSANAALVDSLRWKKFPLLNEGFVCLVDAMGDDQAIVQAARVSYGEGTRQVSDDRSLIRYLMRHQHTTPFEMAELKLLVRVPMDCWRQWIRHRTASVNEYSTRYSVAIDAAQTTPAEAWRLQSGANRQGSEGFLDAAAGAELSAEEGRLHVEARQVYQRRLQSGVAREQARKDLPLATFTEAYWKIDLHNLLHFSSCGWTLTPSGRFRSTPRRSDRRSCGRCSPLSGKHSSIIVWNRLRWAGWSKG